MRTGEYIKPASHAVFYFILFKQVIVSEQNFNLFLLKNRQKLFSLSSALKKCIIDVTLFHLFRLNSRMELNEFKIKILPMRHKLQNYALKLCNDSLDAEDVVQEVLIKLWNQRDKLNEYRNLESLAMSITHNHCIDICRTRKAAAVSYENVQLADKKEYLPDTILEIKDECSLMKIIIDSLPPIQRTIIYMKDVEGYEAEEIGEITGCAPETIRSNLSRGRKKVREKYFQVIKERRNKI